MIKTEFGTELKNKLLVGINKLNSSVSSTLGPSGRNVIIREDDGVIKITKDGVTVARAFNKLEDPIEDIGAQMIKQVSIRSADKVGDGTTTSTLLATVIVSEGIKAITQGSNAVEVKKGIDKAVSAVVSQLKAMSQDISSEDQIKQVATISANNDIEVGTLIATALDKVGNDGVIAIEESKTGETELEVVEGMMIDRGFKSPYFVTNNSMMNAVLEKPLVFLYDGRISSTAQVLPVLQAAAVENQPLLIIAEDIEGEALALLVVNKVNNVLKVCAVKAPDFGERRTHVLEDMAVLTGGTVVSATKGHKIDKMKKDEFTALLGKARMVTVTSKDTTIIDGKGTPEAIEERLNDIRGQIDIAKSNFEVEKLQDRLSKLTGGVAIINVGGMSEVELKEKKDRVDDALHATKAALDQGIVPGGGMALINCIDAVKAAEYSNKDQELGAKIVEKALYAPFSTILANAGEENPYQILSVVKANQKQSMNPLWEGYNVKTSEYMDLLTAGVLDPTKVTRSAIENAASVAGTILTTDSTVYHVGESKKEDIDYSQFMQ
jgi:chaperonin GroEL